MSSPGQKRGNCGHAMASFDGHSFCAAFPALLTRTLLTVSSATCLPLSNMLKYIHLPTSSRKKNGKQNVWITPPSRTIVHLWTLLVSLLLGFLVSLLHLSHLPCLPKRNQRKKEKPPTKAKKSTSATDDRILALDQKWSERFNRLEALLLAKLLEPTFSSDVRVTPAHSPPANVSKDSESFS